MITAAQVRRERALDGLMEEGSVGGSKGDDEDRNSRPQVGLGEEEDEEETKCKAAIEVEKRVYKGSFQVCSNAPSGGAQMLPSK